MLEERDKNTSGRAGRLAVEILVGLLAGATTMSIGQIQEGKLKVNIACDLPIYFLYLQR